MEQYYTNQASMPYFRGATRQRGRGLLTASAVIGAARTIYPIAKPFVKKYVLPAAKRLGTSFIENVVPEVKEIIHGRQKFSRGMRKAAKKTLKSQIGGGRKRGRIAKKKRKKKKTSRRKKTKRSSRSRNFFAKSNTVF